MKKLLAMLLVLCMCTALLTACIPSNLSKGDVPGTDETGGNEGGDQPGGNEGGDQPGGDQGGDQPGGDQGGDQPGGNEGGDQPGGNEGGDQPGGNEGGDQPGGNEGGDQTEELHGEPITAELWEAMTSSNGYPLENCTIRMKSTVMSTTQSEAYVQIAGDEYRLEMHSVNIRVITGSFEINGELGSYQYNTETKKWSKISSDPHIAGASAFPLQGFSVAFEDLIYNEQTGSYSFEESFSMGNAGSVLVSMEVYFRSNHLVAFLYKEQYEYGSTETEWYASHYGTTVVTRPTAAELDDDGDAGVVTLFHPVTEAQFEALKTTPPTNYTYREYRADSTGLGIVIEMMVDGECFMESQYDANGTLTRRWCRVKVGERYVDYGYDIATGKWQEHGNSISVQYPLEGFPMSLSNFTYVAGEGYYEAVIGSSALMLGFDANGMLAILAAGSTTGSRQVDFYNYGTTVIEVPAAEDIIPGNGGVSTGNGGGV